MRPNCCDNKSKIVIQELMEFLNVISDENRLKIICLLNKGEKCVCEIWKNLGIPQNLASYHLKTLKDFKLLNSKKQGLKVIYALNKKNLIKYKKNIDRLFTP